MLNKIENEMNRQDKNRKYYYFFMESRRSFFNYFIGLVKLMMEIKYTIFLLLKDTLHRCEVSMISRVRVCGSVFEMYEYDMNWKNAGIVAKL